jgi:hypothetical protein
MLTVHCLNKAGGCWLIYSSRSYHQRLLACSSENFSSLTSRESVLGHTNYANRLIERLKEQSTKTFPARFVEPHIAVDNDGVGITSKRFDRGQNARQFAPEETPWHVVSRFLPSFQNELAYGEFITPVIEENDTSS